MAAYKVALEEGNILRVGFGDPAQNDQICRDADHRLRQMVEAGELRGGELIKINGPASLPVALVVGHAVGHLFQAIGCFDPKLGKYVVSVAHGDKYHVGDLID